MTTPTTEEAEAAAALAGLAEHLRSGDQLWAEDDLCGAELSDRGYWIALGRFPGAPLPVELGRSATLAGAMATAARRWEEEAGSGR